MAKYIGITIGPILKTMSYTSSPVGLWFSSYFFSMITKRLCERISANASYEIINLRLDDNGEMASSFYDEYNADGVGIFHDRIYCKISDESKTKETVSDELQNIIDEVIAQTEAVDTENKDEWKKFLKKYLNLHFVIIDYDSASKKGLSQTLADALDAMENITNVQIVQNKNILRKWLSGSETKGNNEHLRRHPFIKNVSENNKTGIIKTTKDEIRIKELEDIAKAGIQAKTSKYFAVVQADGDNMGKLLSVEGGSEEEQCKRISKFSDFCTEYIAEAADAINSYGGALIYGGGDDLLFLAPIVVKYEEEKPANIWELCKSIAEKFSIKVDKWILDNQIDIPDNQQPSLSFGVSINYTKFPLYEAVEDARALLFGTAKNFKNKNAIAVNVHKHSGQTAGFVCCLESRNGGETLFNNFLTIIADICKEESDKKDNKEALDKNNEFVKSIIYRMESENFLYETAFLNEDDNDKKVYLTRLLNNAVRKVNNEALKKYIQEIVNIALKIDENVVKGFTDNNDNEYKNVHALSCMLRQAKFLIEGDENE